MRRPSSAASLRGLRALTDAGGRPWAPLDVQDPSGVPGAGRSERNPTTLGLGLCPPPAPRDRTGSRSRKASNKNRRPVPALLDMMAIEGLVVTIRRHRRAAKASPPGSRRKADYIIALKVIRERCTKHVKLFAQSSQGNAAFKDAADQAGLSRITRTAARRAFENRRYTVIP